MPPLPDRLVAICFSLFRLKRTTDHRRVLPAFLVNNRSGSPPIELLATLALFPRICGEEIDAPISKSTAGRSGTQWLPVRGKGRDRDSGRSSTSLSSSTLFCWISQARSQRRRRAAFTSGDVQEDRDPSVHAGDLFQSGLIAKALMTEARGRVRQGDWRVRLVRKSRPARANSPTRRTGSTQWPGSSRRRRRRPARGCHGVDFFLSRGDSGYRPASPKVANGFRVHRTCSGFWKTRQRRSRTASPSIWATGEALGVYARCCRGRHVGCRARTGERGTFSNAIRYAIDRDEAAMTTFQSSLRRSGHTKSSTSLLCRGRKRVGFETVIRGGAKELAAIWK